MSKNDMSLDVLYDEEKSCMGMPNLGRFSDPSILILTSLAGGKKHGYAIMEDVETIAHVRLGTGTLYGAIARLEEYGLIEVLPSEERGRRPYRLTSAGIAFLHEQLTSMETLTALGLRRLATL
jgi:DNA-binding PadR family transcriptional regulator